MLPTDVKNLRQCFPHLAPLEQIRFKKWLNVDDTDGAFRYACNQNITCDFVSNLKNKKAEGKNNILNFWGDGGTGKSFSCLQLLGYSDASIWENITKRVFWEAEDAMNGQKEIGRKQNFMIDERLRKFGLGSNYTSDQIQIVIETAREPQNDIGICRIARYDNPELVHYMLQGLFQLNECAFFLVTRPETKGYLGFVGVQNPQITGHAKEIAEYVKLKQAYNSAQRGVAGSSDMIKRMAEEVMQSEGYKLACTKKMTNDDWFILVNRMFPQLKRNNISREVANEVKFNRKMEDGTNSVV